MNPVTIARFARFLSYVAFGIFALSGVKVSAQNLDAFRSAAAAKGVDVIPFPDLKSTATPIAAEVERAKTEATKYDFSLLERQKNNLFAEIKKTQEEIEKQTAEIEQFKRDHPDGDVSTLEDDLEELEETLAEHREGIEDMNDDTLEDAAEAWKRLWNARGGLREVFDDVLDELDEARSSPDDYLGDSPSAEDVDKLERYIDVIEDEIEIQAKTHLEQENGAKDTEQKFRTLLARNEP
jgi:hypothetical protein